MQIEHGWSGEVQPNTWAKFKVTLEEEDLRRLVGPDIRDELSTGEAYQLMELEAERLVLVKLIARYGFDPQEGKQKLTTLAGQLADLIRKVAARDTSMAGSV